MDYKMANLKTINNGALEELFDAELEKVLKNISDCNTKPDEVREIRLIIKLKPSPDRKTATTIVHASCKLASTMPHQSAFFIATTSDNKIRAYVNDPRQAILPFDDETKVPVQQVAR
jgi:hypothetical protein